MLVARTNRGIRLGELDQDSTDRCAGSSIPDFHATIEDLIAEGDKVAARMIFGGTHTGGEFMGIPPSGRPFAFSATAIFRIEGGKIVEHWGDEDALGWLQQLGAMPAPG